jgi:hypothetical protein
MEEQQIRTMQAAAPDTDDDDVTPLGVEDIPGAVGEFAPQPSEQPAQAGNELRDRLAAFRDRRGGAAGGAGAGAGRPGGGQFAGRAGGAGGARPGAAAGRGAGAGAGAGGGAGARAAGMERALANMSNDPIAAGRKILDQLNQRMATDARGERKPMKAAIQGITRGYEALEQEVAKLRNELNLAHEAIRAVQRESD